MKKTPPIQLRSIGLDPNTFVYSDKKSWRGACPVCGGHRRFVIFTDKEFPLWNGFCSLCGHEIKAWQKVHKPIDPKVLAAANARAAEKEAQRAAYRRKRLAEFSKRELWEELHERMAEEQVAWWESQGIPEAIQDYLRLGWTPERKYYDDFGELRISPAYTIPWFGYGFTLKTMQYRLTNPQNVKDKYRFEKDLGGGRHFYMTKPDEQIRDKVIICEGAKKAIVTDFWLQDGNFTVIAASSNNTVKAALEATKDCGLRYVILDPGSKYWEHKAKMHNPKTTYIVRFPYKVDDGYLRYGLDRARFSRTLDNAI